MRWSQFFIPTIKEVPADADVISHKLMYRAGLIRKLVSGFYTYLPMGLRVLSKIENIIRKEMNKKGALEILMPTLQPRELWETSGRWHTMGPEMMRLKNRQDRDFVLGPTHEEVITDLIAREINSYRQLPLNFYQIQTKFRDEIRPRFGVMRSREFIMKDAYSFDKDAEGAKKSFQDMVEAYQQIFQKCGCSALAVEADTGIMGGESSAEFMVPSDTGEEEMVCCEHCDYAANSEKAESHDLFDQTGDEGALEEVHTPNCTSVSDVSAFLKVQPSCLVKTLLYVHDTDKKVLVLVRGDRNIVEMKLIQYLHASDLRLADEKEIEEVFHAPVGFVGPQGIMGVRVIADMSVLGVVSGITGANKKDYHVKGLNLKRDVPSFEQAHLHQVLQGDPCPKCRKPLQIKKGIEVGHVFNLGTKYSKALGATFLDQAGQSQLAIMGCFGIGVSRTMAAIIEVNHDEQGIVWPVSVAPFEILLMPLYPDDKNMLKEAEHIYTSLQEQGLQVLWDDRDERAGVKFKDAELIGIPYMIILGKKSMAKGLGELEIRRGHQKQDVPLDQIVERSRDLIGHAYRDLGFLDVPQVQGAL